MDKVIVTGLLIVASMTAAVITIAMITPALGSSRDAISDSNRTAIRLVGTELVGLSAVVEDRQGTDVSIWFKNVGSSDIDPISSMDIFMLSSDRLRGRYIPFSEFGIPTDHWNLGPARSSEVWPIGETIQIHLSLNGNPAEYGEHIVSVTTPNGVAGETIFEHWPISGP
tara:strand:- start:15922 stop:16428 length:507 start_codon:yes stop_codon:yes gene_type:complete